MDKKINNWIQQNADENTFEKKRLFWSRITALCTLGILLVVLVLSLSIHSRLASVEEALKAVSSVDVESLNQVANDLQAIVGPLVRLLERIPRF